MSLLEKIQNTTCSLRQQNDWLKIYTCPVPSSDFLSFVGIAVMDVPAQNVLSLLYDIESSTEWVFKTREMKILRELDGDEGRVVYQLVSAPWPLSDREIISQSRGFMDPETGEIFIRITALPDFLPENSDYVRVRQLEGGWNIMPLDNNRSRVVFRLHIEPGGEIPSWLANIAVIDTPYHTLTNMRTMLAKEKYSTPVEAPFTVSAKDVFQNYKEFIDD
ncbi:START domain-containing protein [Prosthecochloris sp. N3]|uniref:START domain-containing protein n=1 Tax=Prosthecochloris ethylica TaxID=2743976 RepID=A0ABR9XPJ1_9CHLB|nr:MULTISPECIES: START domain-containing protein [Prosthecochloris]MBF0586187.1 START domain-containing protein [Prosthecochloris ethylica]MBF0635893.1 START domain-containing protein [Prosthecochloris ethylica]NUK47432.1 START domain-containing protein [Prosthecochloris ethylica]RNA64981.1 cyclase [Prosthecochloris sp. ZM_2]